MLVLITYDVNTEDALGRKRLRRVAKVCTNYGQRVQNSVFECLLTPAQLTVVRKRLLDIMEPTVDSLRIYNLGDHYSTRIEHHGAKPSYDPEAPMIL